MDFAANLTEIRHRISAACERSGREASAVQLMAVSKGQPPEAVAALAAAGQDLFGENKVQEAKAKIPLSPGRLTWHMIGHLQGNKVRDAVELFRMIQSVDSLELAEEINRRAQQHSRTIPILIEVNVAGESSKFGYAPERVLEDLERINALPRIELHGLMTIPPWAPDPEKVRPLFRQVRELKDRCEQKLGVPLPCLSTGMSGDFEVAIEEGATLVRIGTALFGPRKSAKKESTGNERE